MTNVKASALSPRATACATTSRSAPPRSSPPRSAGRVRAAMKSWTRPCGRRRRPQARAHPIDGEWSIAQVVDHIAQTQIRAADELRHLLAGRRPPAPPVYEALTSGAALWAPWDELLDGLRSANDEMEAMPRRDDRRRGRPSTGGRDGADDPPREPARAGRIASHPRHSSPSWTGGSTRSCSACTCSTTARRSGTCALRSPPRRGGSAARSPPQPPASARQNPG